MRTRERRLSSEPPYFPRHCALFWERGTGLEPATACVGSISVRALWRVLRFSRAHAVFSLLLPDQKRVSFSRAHAVFSLLLPDQKRVSYRVQIRAATAASSRFQKARRRWSVTSRGQAIVPAEPSVNPFQGLGTPTADLSLPDAAATPSRCGTSRRRGKNRGRAGCGGSPGCLCAKSCTTAAGRSKSPADPAR
ncbi:MAG: hypothetical protein K0R44_2346 [Thermomicrobiales bacterium]|nr:hypothetical protein [Thermomicrobiales bacterium]